MTYKRKGKEIEGSGNSAGKKQSTVRNHGIHFKDDKQRSKYKSLISRTISPCRYPDVNDMDRLGIEEHVIRLLHNTTLCLGTFKGLWLAPYGVGMMRTDELFMLWAMLYNHPVNICYYLLAYLVSTAKKKPDDKGDIVVGGIITFVARKFGVSVN